MKQISLDETKINSGLLLEEIKDATGLNNFRIEIHHDDNRMNLTIEDDINTTEENIVQSLIAAHNPKQLTKIERQKKRIMEMAQSAVGVNVANLSNQQIKALLAVRLWHDGVFDENLNVLPLKDWAE